MNEVLDPEARAAASEAHKAAAEAAGLAARALDKIASVEKSADERARRTENFEVEIRGALKEVRTGQNEVAVAFTDGLRRVHDRLDGIAKSMNDRAWAFTSKGFWLAITAAAGLIAGILVYLAERVA